MAQPLDYVEYLSKEIGARPAGTEEEQQAALYIADEFQKESGFAASIEEFTSTSNLEGGRAILAMVTIVVSILAMLFNVLTGPALVLAILAAVFYALEAYDRPVLSKPLARGASQNVVAKYEPHVESAEGAPVRPRKIVLLAHYDTGKVVPGVVGRVENSKLPLGMICLGGMIAAAFLLLLRVFVGGTGGAGLVFINVLTIVAILIVALPIVKAVLYRAAPYNEGANNNATGVAALLEVARRISQGSVSEADLLAEGDSAVVHGEQAARESGLVPEGAELSYEVPATFEDDPDATEEERLLAAKAAIAALTGQSVEQRVFNAATTRVSVNGVSAEEPPAVAPEPAEPAGVQAQTAAVAPEAAVAAGQAAVASAAAATVAVAPAPSPEETGGFENAPSWFIAAQRNAKRSASSEPVQRSRYTEAINAAEQTLADRERMRAEEERARRAEQLKAREEATRAAISGQVAGAAGQSEPDLEPIEFAPIDVSSFGSAPVIELEPIQQPADGEAPTVLPAHVGAPAEDPNQTVAYIPEHLRALLQRDAGAQGDKPSVSETARSIEERNAAPDAAGDASAEAVEAAKPQAESGDSVAQEAAGAAPAQQAAAEPALREEAAPEAEPAAVPAEEVAAPAQRSRLAGLPAIGGAAQPAPGSDPAPAEEFAGVPETTNPSRSGLFRMLRTDVPSLSGAIEPVPEATRTGAKARPRNFQVPEVNAGDAKAAPSDADGVSAQAPLSAEADQVDRALDAAGDLGATRAFTHQSVADLLAEGDAQPAADAQPEPEPEPARPTQVSMPKSRAGGFFSKFRHKDDAALRQTPQEWLDVDEDFEAREVGRERGGWESFRADGRGDEADTAAGSAKRTWEGGAFSRVRLGHVSTRSGVDETSDEPEELVEDVQDQAISEEIEQIYHFRNPSYDSEIWFVAIGSDTEQHDGAKAFIEAHRHELRGAMFVEIESLGAGELSYATEEGRFQRLKSSSRIKRFVREATEATGIVLGQVSTAADSISTTVQKAGFPVMHLMGVENGLPALKGSADDILENVDELVFEENVNFLMQLLKQTHQQ